MNLIDDSSTTRSPIAREQEMRRHVGEALREPIPWNQHRAWSIVAERLGDAAPKPPPAFTAEEIRALIAGPAKACPNCGYVPVETR